MSKKRYKLFLASTVTVAMVSSVSVPFHVSNVSAAENLFLDVQPSDYFFDAVMDLANRGVISGYGNGTFLPYHEVTKAEAAKMICLALNLDTKSVIDPGFTDLHTGQWYYRFVAALVEAGIMDGYEEDNTFRPQETISRIEMAKIIATAYELGESIEANTFSDVSNTDQYAGFVGSLLKHNITAGITPTTYAPTQLVTRGQLTIFLYRAELQHSKIENITDTSVVINGKSYTVSNDLKGILSQENAVILKNAKIKFSEKDHVITEITFLEITANGNQASEKAASLVSASSGNQASESLVGHTVLDGKEGIINGSVKINGDFISLKNITVQDDLTIGSKLQNSFHANNLVVKGKTKITDEERNTERIARIIIENSRLKELEMNKKNAELHAKEKALIEKIILSQNAKITAQKQAQIQMILVQEKAKQATINAKIENLIIKTQEDIKLTGIANIKLATVQAAKKVALDLTGEIEKLILKDANSKISLGEKIKVGKIELPTGKKIEDLFEGNVTGKIGPGDTMITPVQPTAPTISLISSDVLYGEAITIIGNRAATIYIIPSTSSSPTEADLEAFVTDGVGKKVELTSINQHAEIDSTGLKAGKYKVYAADKNGRISAPTDVFGIIPLPPTNLVLSTIDNDLQNEGGVVNTITWEDSISDGVVAYSVARNTTGDLLDETTIIASDIPPTTQSIEDTTVEPGVTYYYFVTATTSDNLVNTLAPVSITTANDIADQTAPLLLNGFLHAGDSYTTYGTSSINETTMTIDLTREKITSIADAVSGIITFDEAVLITSALDGLSGESIEIDGMHVFEWSFIGSPTLLEVKEFGIHSYTITATDVAGNEQAYTIVLTFDEVAPILMSGYLTAGDSENQYGTTSVEGTEMTIDLTGVSVDSIDGPVSGVLLFDEEVTITSDLFGLSGTTTVNGDQHIFNWSFLGEPTLLQVKESGMTSHQIIATDASGNAQIFTVTLVFEMPSITSKVITNFDFATSYATQARQESKVMTTTNFAASPKHFTISDGTYTIPIDLTWDIPLNGFSIGAVIGSAVESHIQQYFSDRGMLMERTMAAFGFSDTFFVSSFTPSSSFTITFDGADWSYFFENQQFSGSDPNFSKNKSFTISDGTNSVDILLDQAFSTIDALVANINWQIENAVVPLAFTVEKVNDQQFKIVSEQQGITPIITGTDKSTFFE